MTLIVEALDIEIHNRKIFDSQNDSINQFLKERANKEHKQKVSDTYVIVDDSVREIILGYFTLSLNAVLAHHIPYENSKKLPKYHSYGTILLGRMGRDYHYTPKGFGKIIMQAALLESLKRGTFYAIEIFAKNEMLIKYYQQFGFESLSDHSQHLYLPCATLKLASFQEDAMA